MGQTVVGIFDTYAEAQKAVEELKAHGFTGDSVKLSSKGAGTVPGPNSQTAVSGEEHESGISKFFSNLFGSDDEANKYDSVAAKSDSIVTVYATSEEEADDAADILDDNGAVDVDGRASEYGYGSTATTTSVESGTINDAPTATGNTIPIIEETLEVGKRTVQTGGVRLRSRIVERPVEEQLRLRQERIKVGRVAVDRPATDADFAAFKEGEIELTETAEVPVVSKTARVVEEVSLGKDVTEQEKTISDTVRKTVVDVEDVTTATKTSLTGIDLID